MRVLMPIMKMVSVFSVILNVVLLAAVQGETGCPPSEDVKPCSCHGGTSYDTTLICSGINDDADLRAVFLHSKKYKYKEVHLIFSNLKYLPQEMFENAEVSELHIQNSTLNALFDSPPDSLHHLYKLHLENTRIIELSHWELITPLTDLHILTIYYNLVETIDLIFEKHVPKTLTQLTLYSTGTKEIQPGAFLEFTNLDKIAVDACKLKQLSRDIFPNPFNGRFLYFQENELTSIPNDLFTNMPNLQTVGLKNNYLTTLSGAAFGGNVASIEYVLLDDNPLKCDCSLLWLIRNKPENLSGTCATPIRFHDKKLKDLSPGDFKC